MMFWAVGLLLCATWSGEAADSKYVDYNGKQVQRPMTEERKMLQRFLGLRHRPKARHPVVIHHSQHIHHGLHMLNHQVAHAVGPLKSKMLKPFGKANHSIHDELANSTIVAKYSVAGGWDKIKLSRASMCVTMIKKHGLDFDVNKDKCIGFMDATCKVKKGKEKKASKNPKKYIKQPSGEGICEEWFRLLFMVKSGKDPRQEGVAGAAPAGAPGAAPSPAMAASPGMPDGLQPSSPYGMDEGAGSPEQGFSGKNVAHDNMVTQTSDWHTEYGPHAPHLSYEAICAQYPDNQWCKLHGYHNKKPAPKSGTRSNVAVLSLMAPLLLGVFC